MDWDVISSIILAAVRMAVPLLLIAMAELWSERAGMVNIGLEGIAAVGALAGFMLTYYTGSTWMGILGGAVAGILVNMIYAYATVTLCANHTVYGMAINLLAPALASFIYRVSFGAGGLNQIELMKGIAIPGLKDIPFIGELLFNQTPMVYLAFALVIFTNVYFRRTRSGLNFKSVGEHPKAAATLGINVIGIPATIDNDIGCTNYCIGFDTAANTALECVDRLRDTMQSHERCSVVEVMGRNAGYLAMYVGLAVGATAILVPEKPIDFERDVIEKIRQARFRGFSHYMIVVAEGAGNATEIAKKIHEAIDMEPRVTVLGHIQRGGTPTARDRVNATKMGYLAVELLLAGKSKRIVCTHEGGYIDVDIDEGLEMKKSIQEMEVDVLTAMTGLVDG